MTSDTPRSIRLEIPGMTIAGLEWGDPDGRPLLGLHGWLDNAATMSGLGPLLEDYRLVSVDLPGHGKSDHRAPGQPYHFADLVPVVFDVADALSFEEFSLLGHSMGGAAAFLAAGSLPDRIRALVAIDSLGPWTTPPDEAPVQLEKSLDERQTLREKSKRSFDSPDDAISVITKLYGLAQSMARPLVERGLEQRDDGDWQFSYDLRLRGASLVRLTEPQVLAFLGRVVAPCLLIRPENGWPVDDDWSNRRAESLDSLEIRRISGGHHAHLESPRAVADLTANFLDHHH